MKRKKNKKLKSVLKNQVKIFSGKDDFLKKLESLKKEVKNESKKI